MICMQNPQENTSLEILNLGSTVTPAELGTTLYDKPVVSIVFFWVATAVATSNILKPWTMWEKIPQNDPDSAL